MSKSKVLFLLSGSIAAYKACQVISRLVQEGHEVQTAATAAALRFVGPATLEGLSGRPVLSDLWQPGRAMDHIALTRWADLAVLCPASANSLARLAHGLADEVVSALALAWPLEKPFHLFPAMNSVMLSAPSTQENLRLLTARGYSLAPTGCGGLACGAQGEGRLLDPEEIFARLTAGRPRGRILITAGATREPIDGIRFLSNVSTGQTGATLADEMSRAGWRVTHLHGQGASLPRLAAHRLAFGDFADLERKLRAELDQRDYAAVIHCAAVSDYSVDGADTTVKRPSSDQPLNIQLRPNAKLLPRLKKFSRAKNIFVVGFKLTLNAGAEQCQSRARDLLGEGVDAVVANDWASVSADRARHPGWLLNRDRSVVFNDLPGLARELQKFIPGGLHDSMS